MKFFKTLPLLFVMLLFSGCLYDFAPSQPASQINTALVGIWTTQDRNGNVFEATITPESNLQYHVSCCNKDKNEKTPWEFDGFISRVDDLKILTLRSLSTDPRYQGKYLLFHYEVMALEKAPIDSVAARRIRLTQLQLEETACHLKPYPLRQAIRERLEQQSLLPSEGSVVWTKVGSVTWQGK